MKIAFNIARMNRYRDLSAVIAVALKRGWDVECWHAKYEDNRHKENTPCLKKVPFFRYGTPKIIEYCKEQDLRYLLTNSGCSVVVDTDPRHFSLPDLCEHSENRPLTVLVDGIANPVLRTTYVKLPKFDIFFTPSYDQTDLTIKLRSRTRNSIIEEIWKNKKTLGKKVCKRLEKNVSNQWNEGDYTLYKNRCVVVGTPYLDDLNLVDRDNIRKSWGISNSAKVVGYLPSPWDMPLGFFWGDLNMSNNYLERFICCLRHKKCNFYKYICKTPTDIDYVKLIRKFCDNNDAFFVTKLRHSRNATPYLKNWNVLQQGHLMLIWNYLNFQKIFTRRHLCKPPIHGMVSSGRFHQIKHLIFFRKPQLATSRLTIFSK